MDCYFIYKDTKFKDFSLAYQKAYENFTYKPERLIFYSRATSLLHDEYKKTISAIVSEYKKREKSNEYKNNHQSVTSLINHILNLDYANSVSDIDKLIDDINIQLGTSIHECFLYYTENTYVLTGSSSDPAKSQKAFNDLINLQNKLRERVLKLFNVNSQEELEILLNNPQNTYSTKYSNDKLLLMFKILFVGEHNLRVTTQNAIKSFRKKIEPNSTVYYEIPIDSNKKINNLYYLTGRLDCLVIGPTGKVSVYDFKTTLLDLFSSVSLKKHYLQLAIYKEMLAKWGISLDDIYFDNFSLSLNERGVEKMGNDGFGVFLNDMDAKSKSNLLAKLTQYFPTFNSTTRTDALQTIVSTQNLIQSVFTAAHLNKSLENGFKEWLLKRLKNNSSTSIHSEAYSSIIKVKIIDGGTEDNPNIEIEKLDYFTKVHTTIKDSLNNFVLKEVTSKEKTMEGVVAQYKKVFRSENRNQKSLLELISKNDDNQSHILVNLSNYLSSEWELVENSIFDKFGILCFYNVTSRSYDFIALSDVYDFDKRFELSLSNSEDEYSFYLLSNILDRKTLLNFKAAKVDATCGNIEMLKAFLVVTNCEKYLNRDSLTSKIKIGSIKAVSINNGTSTGNINYTPFLNQIAILASEKTPNIKNKQLFKDSFDSLRNIDFLSATDVLTIRLRSILDTGENIEEGAFGNLRRVLSMDDINAKLKNLQKIRDLALADKNIGQKAFGRKILAGETTEAFALLSMLILAYENLLASDIKKVPEIGGSISSWYLAIREIYNNGELPEHTGNGEMVVGPFLGEYWAIPSTSKNEYVRKFNALYQEGIRLVINSINPLIVNMTSTYSKWWKALSNKGVETITGVMDYRWKKFFEQDKDGKISKTFRLINPFHYKGSALSSNDLEYLKVVLWNLTRCSYNLLDAFSPETKSKNFDLLNETEKSNFIDWLDKDVNRLNAPIRKASDITRVGNTLKSATEGHFKKAYNDFVHYLKDKTKFDGRKLNELLQREKLTNIESLKAFNRYNDLKERDSYIEQLGVENLEINLNFLTEDFAISSVLYKVDKDLLRVIDQMCTAIKYSELITGRDLSKALTDLLDRMKINIYNEPISDQEYLDTLGLLRTIKSIASDLLIGFRPVLYLKEMTVGSVKNYLYSYVEYFKNEGITTSLIAKARKQVLKEGIWEDKFKKLTGMIPIENRALIDALNDWYLIANRDANILANKLDISKRGLRINSDMAYRNVLSPDWFNRMTILVAKMMADGVWDEKVHYLDLDGNLHYNMAEDPRYKVFWKYKDNEDALPKNSKEYKTFLEQKARYEFALNEFLNSSSLNIHNKKLEYGDLLPLAYTQREITSLKEITGTLYGFMQHDEKTRGQLDSTGEMFMQFKSYLSGEIRHWFGHADNGSSRGKITLKRDVDGKLLYYAKDKVTGEFIETTEEMTDGEYNKPVMEWLGIPTEGLVDNFIKALKYIKTPEGRKILREDPQKIGLLFIFFLRILMFSLLGSLFGYFAASIGNKDELKFHEKGVIYALDALLKSTEDLSFYNSIAKVVTDANIAGVEFLTNVADRTVLSIANGNGDVAKTIYSSVGAIKDFQF